MDATPKLLLATLLGLSLLAIPGRATAAGACRPDAERLCKGIAPGGGRILACLKSHDSELSAPCQEELAAARERVAEFRKACGADARALCKGIPPGRGRILACLRSHESDLSPGCKAALAR